MRCLALTASQQQHSTEMPAELAASSVYEAKAIGTMLGAMSGNVLGAPFEHDRHFRITRMHPYGILDFWHFDLAQQPVPYGHYTGDFGTMLAVAQALITSGKANVFDIAGALAAHS
jgi:ADP-ribosylglycohydrolase